MSFNQSLLKRNNDYLTKKLSTTKFIWLKVFDEDRVVKNNILTQNNIFFIEIEENGMVLSKVFFDILFNEMILFAKGVLFKMKQPSICNPKKSYDSE